MEQVLSETFDRIGLDCNIDLWIVKHENATNPQCITFAYDQETKCILLKDSFATSYEKTFHKMVSCFSS